MRNGKGVSSRGVRLPVVQPVPTGSTVQIAGRIANVRAIARKNDAPGFDDLRVATLAGELRPRNPP